MKKICSLQPNLSGTQWMLMQVDMLQRVFSFLPFCKEYRYPIRSRLQTTLSSNLQHVNYTLSWIVVIFTQVVNYRPQTKLREGNIFTMSVIHSVHRGGGVKLIKINYREKQECIPVGCIPAAHWPYAGGLVSLPEGVSLPGGSPCQWEFSLPETPLLTEWQTRVKT